MIGSGDADAASAAAPQSRLHHHQQLLHRRHTSSPGQCQRRVIFPILHGGPPPSPSLPAPSSSGRATKEEGFVDHREAGNGDASDIAADHPGPCRVLPRACSLDGISTLLPRLSLPSSSGASGSGSGGASKNFGAGGRESSRPSSSSSSSSSDRRAIVGQSPRSVLGPGDAIMRHRPYYYPAASPPPPPVCPSPTPSGPPPSILRGGGCGGRSAASSSSSAIAPSSPQPPTPARLLPDEMPTLASPASIVALRSSRGGGDDDGDGSGHRDPECLLSDIPKLLPHHRPPTIRKSRSISIVDGNNDDRTHHRPDSFASSSRSSDPSSSSPSRHESFECLAGRRRRVSFDPHITVHEFGVTGFERRGGGKWWSERELEEFKKEAIQRIRSRCATIVPTGTGRSLAVPPSLAAGGGGAAGGAGNVSFNHPALGCEDEYDPRELPAARDDAIVGHLSQEIRNILVVDPHEVFLSLFRKSLKHMIPHAAVATAQSTEEALVRIEAAQRAFPVKDGGSAHGFDVIIVEENLSSGGPTGPAHRRDDSSQSAGDDSVQRRWNMTSGSCLCCHLAESQRLYGSEVAGEGSRLTLIIGVSARLDEHRERLEKAGADCVWGKPPPEMNVMLRNDLLKTLMKKRRRRVDFRLFDAG